MTIEPGIKKRIDDMIEAEKQRIIEKGGSSPVDIVDLAMSTFSFILKSKSYGECREYALEQLKKASSYIASYRGVKYFLKNLQPPAFSTAFLGLAKYRRGHIVLFEEGRFVTAETRISGLRVFEDETTAVGYGEPEYRLVDETPWDGSLEAVVDSIEEHPKSSIVLAGGAHHMPRDYRLRFAASVFVTYHYLHTKGQGPGE
jgi:hypothetical protein